MVVAAMFLHADPTLTGNGINQGDTDMKNRINRLLATFLTVLAWSSSAYAGCTNTQFAGTWDVVFADGNSCRLVLDNDGDVLISGDRNQSVCFDPFRGVTEPDSGTVVVGSDCVANFSLSVEGVTIEMLGRIANPRTIGAGGFLIFVPGVPDPVAKGAFTMVRAE
jgi:hypothetical protein